MKRKRCQQKEKETAAQRVKVDVKDKYKDQGIVLNALATSAQGVNLDGLELLDRKKYFRLFECCAALEHNMLLWSCLSPDVLNEKKASRYGAFFPDLGIDMASSDLTRTGQAKFFAPGSSVGLRQVGTFYMYSKGRFGATELQLCASEDVTFKHAFADMHFSNLSYDRMRYWIILSREFIASVPLQLDEKKTLRPYQTEAMECALKLFAGGNRNIRFHVCCGSGKTVIYAHLMEHLLSRNRTDKILMLVPSKLLLHQAVQALHWWFPEMNIGRVGDGYRETDARCIVCIYHSVRYVRDMSFVLKIVDEAHHLETTVIEYDKDRDENDIEENPEDWEENKMESEGEQASNIEKGLCLHEIDESKEKPKVEEEEEEEEVCEDFHTYRNHIVEVNSVHTLYASGSLTDQFAELDFSYRMCQAIAEGFLVDFNLVFPILTETKKSSHSQIIRLIEQHAEWSHVLVYASSRREASEFAVALNNKNLPAAYMDGKTPISQRQNHIIAFQRGQLRALVTVKILGEGVNIPEANTALFLNRSDSCIWLQQSVSRVIRPYLPNKLAYIVLPASQDDYDLKKFLTRLSDFDSRIRKESRMAQSGRLDAVCDRENEPASNELLSINLLERVSKVLVFRDWAGYYELTKEWMTIHQKQIPSATVFRGVHLGHWIRYQRQHRKVISDARKQLLEMLPFWSWNPLQELWIERLNLVKEYMSEMKQLPPDGLEYKGIHIGRWLMFQRSFYRKGKLSKEKIQKLNELQDWTWEPHHDAWKENFAIFKKWCAEHKGVAPSNLQVVENDQGEEVLIGYWIALQRAKFSSGTLPPDRLKLLNEIPFWFRTVKEWKWFETYEVVKEWINLHKKRLSQYVIYKGIKIGLWANNQRREYQTKVLKKERIAKLNEIPLWTW